MAITVVGSYNTDIVMQVADFPQGGETVRATANYHLMDGGKGANQAVAASRLGQRVNFIGRIGEDVFGARARKSLKTEGLDSDCLIIDEKSPTGMAQIMVNQLGENIISVAQGANGNLCIEDLERFASLVDESDVFLAQLEVPWKTVAWGLERCKAAGGTTILNPAPAMPLSDRALSLVDVITPNETEAQILTGIEIQNEFDAHQAATELRSRGVSTVFITMGGKGCYLLCDDYEGLISPCKALVVDTTAAGDTFNGALAVSIMEGKPMREAARFANAAAALSVEKLGAQASMPYRKDVDQTVVRKRI
ncbi:ribokinase [Puniceicoccaceae bacterium K14]|nr:ribokinase [Puniceicoccaceae bacterium K14]